KTRFVKAVCLVATGGCGCRFARVRQRAETDRDRETACPDASTRRLSAGKPQVLHRSKASGIGGKAETATGRGWRGTAATRRQGDTAASGRRPVRTARKPRSEEETQGGMAWRPSNS